MRYNHPGVHARFTRMWQLGHSYEYIGNHFGISRGTVHLWRLRLGLPCRQRAVRYTDAEAAGRFVDAWSKGESYKRLAWSFGISIGAVTLWRHRLGLPGRYRTRYAGPEEDRCSAS